MPTLRVPTFEVLGAYFDVKKEKIGSGESLVAKINMKIYVVPADDRRVVFPVHHAYLLLELRRPPMALSNPEFRLQVPDSVATRGFGNRSLTVRVSTSELLVDGPGSFLMSSEGVLTDLEGYQEEGVMTAHLKMAGSPAVVVLKAKLRRMDLEDSIATWFLWRDFEFLR